MDKEVITYNGKRYTRYPKSKRRHLREYYWHHGAWKKPPVSLHTQIWRDNNGDIPKGYIIHHKDGNPRHNSIGNLECITEKEHRAKHYADKEWAKKTRASLKRGAKNRKFYSYVCKECGKDFKSKRTFNVNFCSGKCYQRWYKKYKKGGICL